MPPELHNQLNFENREIRVLTLRAGHWSDRIQCGMSVVSLDAEPDYQALSYVWGDPSNKLEISVNHFSYMITENLFRALRRLRKNDATRTIWIDAVCINQADIEERNQQVSIMGDIYNSAREVLIWLGDITEAGKLPPIVWYDDDRDRNKLTEYFRTDAAGDRVLPNSYPELVDTYSTFIFLHLMADNTHLYDLPFFKDSGDLEHSLQPTSQWEQAVRGLQHLTALPWWNRIWVLQEAVLPPEATAHFWQYFFAMEDAKRPFAEEEILLAFKKVVRGIEMLRDGRVKRMETSLSQLLSTTQDRSATDDRDKVYALFALVTNWYDREPIFPDYASTPAQTYAQAVVAEIQGSRSLQILQGVPIDSISGLPSWVKRRGTEVMSVTQRARIGISSLFDAAKGRLCDVRVLENSVIGVLGHSDSDTVCRVSQEVWGQTRETCNVEPMEAALKAWQDIAEIGTEPNRPYPSGGTWGDNYWRAIANDAIDGTSSAGEEAVTEEKAYRTTWRRLTAQDRVVYEAWWLRTQIAAAFDGPDGTPLPGRSAFNHVPESLRIIYDLAMRVTTLQRKLFITEKVYMGTGPLATSPGDRITVLFGGDVPFLLRREANPGFLDTFSGEMMPYWTLVGDCYVHGIMDGEAMEGWEEEKVRYLLR